VLLGIFVIFVVSLVAMERMGRIALPDRFIVQGRQEAR
jgi:hypothetical protein